MGLTRNMLLFRLLFESLQLLRGNANGFIFASVKIQTQHFDQDGVRLIDADGQVDCRLQRIKAKRVSIWIEDSGTIMKSVSIVLRYI